jgi:mannose-6-phosphate isomerase-like protein (cupin superfamily)
MQYHVATFDSSQLVVPVAYERHARGFTQANLINRSHGSVHMQACVSALAPDGWTERTIHAFEKGIYVLDGQLDVTRGDETFRLRADDYALIPYGAAHALRNSGVHDTRWFEMLSPQPKPASAWRDTFFQGQVAWPDAIESLDTQSPPSASTGHFRPQQPMAPRAPGVQGLSVYRFMEQKFGARQFFMMRGNLDPGGFRSRHDHTVEEFYLGLSGECDMDIEDRTFELKRGVVVWTGVGTSHAFRHKGEAPFQWIETQAPQFPAHNGTRNYQDWDRLAGRT